MKLKIENLAGQCPGDDFSFVNLSFADYNVRMVYCLLNVRFSYFDHSYYSLLLGILLISLQSRHQQKDNENYEWHFSN